MKKALLIIACVLVVLLIALGAGMWWIMNRPLYQPGQVRTLASLDPPAQAAAGEYWDVGSNIRLYHFAEGVGKTVLFVHGGPGFPPAKPAPGLSRLAGKYQTVYYHQRGCGKSTRPIDRFESRNYFGNMKQLDAALGLQAQVADIERIRRILGQDKLTIVGHSFGGFLASLYAAEFPERVRGLVLVAPAAVLVMPSGEPDMFEEIGRLLPASSRPAYKDFRKRYFDFSRVFVKSEADLRALNGEMEPFYQQAAATKYRSAMQADALAENGGWMVQGMYLSMGRRHDFREPMKAVQAPVLVLHSENDLQSQASSEVYSKAFPNARLAVIRNCGHFSMFDQPDEFAAITGKFLDELK